MGKTCTTHYFDINGERSGAYYNNLHLGEEAALKAYMEDMKGFAFHSAQKGSMTPDDLVARSAQFKLTEDEENYVDKEGNVYDRTTGALGTVLPNNDDEFFKQKTMERAIKNKALELIMSDPNKYGYTKPQVRDVSKIRIGEGKDVDGEAVMFGELAMEHAQEWAADPDTKGEFESRVADIQSLFDFKREAGTEAHEVAEKYVEERNKLIAEEDGFLDIKKAQELALEGMPNKEEYRKLIKEVEKFLKTVGRGRKVRFEPELMIGDSELKVAGSVDLMAFTDDGQVMIFDYKTKEKNKEYMFDASFGRLKGPMSHLHNNKRTHGALQTSVYRLILERAGFNVVDSAILYVEADIEEVDGGFTYQNFEHKKNINLPYYRSEVVKFFVERGISKDKIDVPRVRESDKSNDSKEFIDNLHGGDVESLYNIPEKIAAELAEPKINAINGKQYFNDKVDGKKVYYKSDKKADRKAQLKEYYEKEKTLTGELAGKLVKYFNDGAEKGAWGHGSYDTDFERQANFLLAGTHKDTHTIQQVRSMPGFSHVDPNMIIITDRVNGAATFLNIEHTFSKPIPFDNKNTTVFGNHISDATVKRNLKEVFNGTYEAMEGFENETKNYKLLEAGFIAAEMMKNGQIRSVYNVKTGMLDGYSDVVPTVVGMHTLLPQLKLAAKLTEDTQSKYVKELFSDTNSMSESAYKVSFIDRLAFQLETGFADIKHRKDLLDPLRKKLEDRDDSLLEDPELLSILIEMQNAQTRSLSQNAKDIKAISDNADARILAQTIVELMTSELLIGEMTKMNADWIIRAPGRQENPAIQELNSVVNLNKQQIASNFRRFKSKHKKLIKALQNQYGLDNVVSSKLNVDQSRIFDNLWREHPQNEHDASKSDDLMRLKDPNDGSLTSAEKAYIEFFNDAIEEGFKMSLGEKSAKFRNGFNHKGGVESNLWPKGTVPIMHASYENIMQRTEGLKNKLAQFKEKLGQRDRKTSEEFENIDANIKERYSEQMRKVKRFKKLGLDAEGHLVDESVKTPETNLESILHHFVVDNSMVAEYKETIGLYKAINVIAQIEENEHFNKTDKLQKYLQGYMKYIVFNELEKYDKKNKKLAKGIEKTHKALSLAALGLSMKQFIVEISSTTYATMSTALQQTILQIAKKEHRFTGASWSKAAVEVSRTTKKVKAMTAEWGLYKIDPEALASKEFQETKKGHWFQSSMAYWLNNIPFRKVKQQTFVATLMHMGVYDAMGTDADGNLTYDATKDKRFKNILDRKGELKKNIKSDADIRAKAEYEFLLKELSTEEGLDENGKPMRPISFHDIKSIQDYTMGAFGSMDKDNKMLFQAGLIGQLFMKFKGWMPIKFQNYWTPRHDSLTRSETYWVEDPSHPDGGYMGRKAIMNEGIIQTIGGLSQDLYNIYKIDGFKNGDFKGEFGKLNQIQQENFSKLLSDIILVTILTSLITMALGEGDDDEERSKTTKLILEVLLNTTSDLNILQLSSGLISQSPIAAFGYAQRALRTLSSTAVFLSTGEFGDAGRGLAEFTGAGKSLIAPYDDLFHEEE